MWILTLAEVLTGTCVRRHPIRWFGGLYDKLRHSPHVFYFDRKKHNYINILIQLPPEGC